MVDLRWDGDERGEGVADATAFVAGAVEMVDAMRLPRWVAEEPESHLLPHMERACRALPFAIDGAAVGDQGWFDLGSDGRMGRARLVRSARRSLPSSRLPRSRPTSGSVESRDLRTM